jgi:hypothetical protein
MLPIRSKGGIVGNGPENPFCVITPQLKEIHLRIEDILSLARLAAVHQKTEGAA